MAEVKLFRPERLTDNPDGGGLATATEVVDGQVNNLFDDISRIDRVNGELSLRKSFALAATADTELYSDLHAIVQAPPQDPRVSAVLFRTKSGANYLWDDERDGAKAQVERYLDESVISRMLPYDRQLQGQRTVLVYQRKEASLPEIGEVYALKNDTTGAIEFIKVQDIDHGVETFTDSNGDYQARVITMTISQPLTQEFGGSQPNRYFRLDDGKSVLRKTIASDAARYKGVVALAQDASIGDLSIKVESIFAQLVPAATSEVPITDAEPGGVVSLIPSRSDVLIVPTSEIDWSSGQKVYLPGAVVPGTLKYVEGINDRVRVSDDGMGNVFDVDTTVKVGVIDYLTGTISTTSSVFKYISSARWQPAAPVSKASLSYMIPVQVQNRGYVYVATLDPPPAPGSTVLSFRAQGRWYTMEDDGSGVLVGATGVGTGQVNFQTGAVQATLGALPDIGSVVIIAYGGNSEYEIRTADASIKPPEIRGTVEEGNVEPSTFSISWLSGGVTKTAADNGSGVLSGDGTGRVIYSTGEYVLRPTLLPDSNSEYGIDYESGATVQDTFTPSKLGGGELSLSISNYPVRPGSVLAEYTGTSEGHYANYTRSRRLTDDGAGHLVDEAGAQVVGSTINYTTGLITFDPDFNSYVPEAGVANVDSPIPGRVISSDNGRYYIEIPGEGEQRKILKAWENQIKLVPFVDGTVVTVHSKLDSVVDVAQTETAPAQSISVDFLPLVNNAIVPGGLLFAMGGQTYFDRNGILYRNLDADTGASTQTGTVDYGSGTAVITSWTGGLAPALTVKALLTIVAQLPLSSVAGRTPGSPLRPGTFYLQANRYRDGALITALADNNGNFSTGAIHGSIDVTTGAFSAAFGAYVLDSSLTTDDKAEPWYNAANVDADGYIWRPDEAVPGSVTFNCVVQVTLPQDPEIIKVNPVRLPSDGRVPILRPGDTLVIHDTQAVTFPGSLTDGQVVDLGRTELSSVAIYDANGLGISTDLFTADLAAGEVTMADPLDLGSYVEPLVGLHTVEDMALCTDAQITGDVILGQALTHGYTADNSLCSSALIMGDAQARYERLFAQATWTNVWSDTLIGSAPSSGAQYNDTTYPIQVLNRDAITQRWRLAFTSSIAFDIVGEEIGIVGTGTTSADVAPINPATGEPYFTLLAAGFGTGWGTGNNIRFNTIAAGAPMWCARTVLSGPATEQDDLIRLQLRWDKD